MEGSKKVIRGVVIFIVVIAVGFGIYYLFFREKPTEVAPAQEVTPPTAQAQVGEPMAKGKVQGPIEVELDKSDELMRELTKGFSSNPTFASWLMTKDLIRKFVAAVDNIAQGMSPKSQVDFFSPKGQFMVIKRRGKFYLDPESYVRYKPAVEVFLSLDSRACVELYRRLKSPIQQAYRDLGYPEQDFDETLTLAIIELLKVPVVQGEIRLEERVISYGISDRELEDLSDAQKHLLRMGPENVQKIQTKLREIASELGIPSKRIPQPKAYQPR
jgi:hypothetical protein